MSFNFADLLKAGVLGTALFLVCGNQAQAGTFKFQVVVNNSDLVPGTAKPFNSYNQPSVNDIGLVVFRARSRGGMGQPATGIFTRDMRNQAIPRLIVPIATRDGDVSVPNNTGATFNEFPSFPRIGMNSSMVAFRGQSTPVWQVSDPDSERLGTSGVYTNPGNTLTTGASQLGTLSGFEYFSVPGPSVPSGIRFDQFPGAPSVTKNKIVFKGNWTGGDTISQTGVYFRDVVADSGRSPVQFIADSNTIIPNDPMGRMFGSTAPPSAADNQVVFLGVDNEENPEVGGIYLSSLLGDPTDLKTLVSIGGLADIVGGGGLTAIEEILSFDGQSVAFWGAWGDEFFKQLVSCPEEGNQARREYCFEQSEIIGEGNGAFVFDIPVNQGIFVTDTETMETQLIAQTGEEFSSFLFWNFSGRPPGVGGGEDDEGDLELARWRASAFMALDGFRIAFKGANLDLGMDGIYTRGMEGIYSQLVGNSPLMTVVETGMDGGILDPEAVGLPIVSVGLERDGFRNGWLAFAASMAIEGETEGEVESWAGIYVTRTTPETSSLFGMLGFSTLCLYLKSRKKA